MSHANHPEIVARLKRAEGHLRSILAMFENGRDCLVLAQQLHAVENAVANAKRELIHAHMEICLYDAGMETPAQAKRALKELRALTKYL